MKINQPRRKQRGMVVLIRYLTQGPYPWFRPKAPPRERALGYGPFATNQQPRPQAQQTREEAQGGLPPFPGHGRPRDEELTRLRKEVKALRAANEILKKAAEL
jgi:hypothetical protein